MCSGRPRDNREFPGGFRLGPYPGGSSPAISCGPLGATGTADQSEPHAAVGLTLPGGLRRLWGTTVRGGSLGYATGVAPPPSGDTFEQRQHCRRLRILLPERTTERRAGLPLTGVGTSVSGKLGRGVDLNPGE